jgi:hypothetical protein
MPLGVIRWSDDCRMRQHMAINCNNVRREPTVTRTNDIKKSILRRPRSGSLGDRHFLRGRVSCQPPVNRDFASRFQFLGALVDRLDDLSSHVTQAPDAVTDDVANDLSAVESMVSRVGIEPTTRRLRVHGWMSAGIQPVVLLSNLTSQCPAMSTVSAEVHRLGFHIGFQKKLPCQRTSPGFLTSHS